MSEPMITEPVVLSEPEAIRQEMDETRDSLTDKIGALEQQVVETVQQASSGVQETVQSVKEAVADTVQSVKETFSLTTQVQRNPWLIMAGSAGIGFLAGYLFNGQPQHVRRSIPTEPHEPRYPSNGSYRAPSITPAMSEPESIAETPSRFKPVSDLMGVFESEINQIKGLAIGALAGIVRDMVVGVAPEKIQSPLTKVFNDVTDKLGGQTFQGRVLSEDWSAVFNQTPAATEKAEPGFHNTRQSSFTSN